MPEDRSIIRTNIAHYRALLKSDMCDEARAHVKRLLATGLAHFQPAASAKHPTSDHVGTRIEQIMERLDRIDDELDAGPHRKRHVVTSRGECLDDFDNAAEAGDWKARQAELANERRELNDEWERVTESGEN